MQFVAEIRRPSAVHRNWFKRSMPLVFGVISGVRFYLKGKTYVAENLAADEVESVRKNPHVIVSVFTAPPTEISPKPVVSTVAEIEEKPIKAETIHADETNTTPVAVAVIEPEQPVVEKRRPGRPRKNP